MHPNARRAALCTLGLAFALAAMVLGHAIELALERAGVFGESRAAYAHVLQGPAELAIVGLALLALAALGISVAHAVGARSAAAASIVPAMDALRRVGALRLATRIAAIQLTALVGVELLEQRLSGVAHPSIAAVFGAGHWTAPIIQFAMALLAALALGSLARMSCDHADDLLRAARTIARFLIVAPQTVRPSAFSTSDRPQRHVHAAHPLAFRIANRPPPAIATARA